MNWIVYGANGYTGELVAREAARRTLRPILAGRNEPAIAALARELDLEFRAFDLQDPDTVDRGLAGIELLLHCAGPFVHTSPPMVQACLRNGIHYLDITGEIGIFESLHRLSQRAVDAGVALLPGVGFDVVPTDCLAAMLAAELPDATHLELAFISDQSGASRGTLKTAVEGLPHVGAIRREGKIARVPIAYDAKEIEFGHGKRLTMTVPWGDVSTAYRSTGIPNIRVYTGVPPAALARFRRFRPLLPLAGLKPVKRLIQWQIGRQVSGPSQAQRESARTYVWGSVTNAEGKTMIGTLATPEAYAFTATSAVECAHRVLHDPPAPGFLTPSKAFGSQFVGEFDGVEVDAIRSS